MPIYLDFVTKTDVWIRKSPSNRKNFGSMIKILIHEVSLDQLHDLCERTVPSRTQWCHKFHQKSIWCWLQTKFVLTIVKKNVKIPVMAGKSLLWPCIRISRVIQIRRKGFLYFTYEIDNVNTKMTQNGKFGYILISSLVEQRPTSSNICLMMLDAVGLGSQTK